MNTQEQPMQRALHVCAEQAIPDSLDLWPRIRAQAGASQQPARKIMILPMRLHPIPLVLLLILLTGAACATVAVIQKAFFEHTPGMSGMVQAGLVHDVNQIQTIGDVTVTLHNAYADARRFAMGVSVHGARGDDYGITVRSPVINGSPLRGLHFTGSVGNDWKLVDGEAAPNEEPGFIYEVDLFEDISPAIAELTTIRSDSTPAMIQVQIELQVIDSHDPASFGPTGPFRFRFDMPIQPAHRIDVHQTRDEAGVAITLKEVIITPSLMQARLCFDPTGSGDGWDATIMAVQPNRQQIPSRPGVHVNPDCLLSTLYGVQGDPTGVWTLSINEIKSDTKTINGPWTFQFEVLKSRHSGEHQTQP